MCSHTDFYVNCFIVNPNMQTIQNALTNDPKLKVWDIILNHHRTSKQYLNSFIEGHLKPVDFKLTIKNLPYSYWNFGIKTYNIRLSSVLCKNACSYCYVAPMFARWKHKCDNIDIEELMPSDMKKVNKKWRRVEDDMRTMYFFPSTSDIFEETAKDYVTSCISIMKAGHEIMFVTKPTMKSISAVIQEFEKCAYNYKRQLVVFITVSTDDDTVLRKFEPNTSRFEERLNVIRFLTSIDINVNVISEPYLSNPISFIDKILEILPSNGIIALGKMNYKSNIRLNQDDSIDNQLKQYLDELYSKKNVKKLWNNIKNNNRVLIKKTTFKDIVKLC